MKRTFAVILAGGRLPVSPSCPRRGRSPRCFGGKFRIMLRAFELRELEIFNVGVLTQYHPRSLRTTSGRARRGTWTANGAGSGSASPTSGWAKRGWYRGTADAVLQNMLGHRTGAATCSCCRGITSTTWITRPSRAFHRKRRRRDHRRPSPARRGEPLGVLEWTVGLVTEFQEGPQAARVATSSAGRLRLLSAPSTAGSTRATPTSEATFSRRWCRTAPGLATVRWLLAGRRDHRLSYWEANMELLDDRRRSSSTTRLADLHPVRGARAGGSGRRPRSAGA